MRICLWKFAAAAGLVTLPVSGPAFSKCLDDVQAMAESHGISSKPPMAPPDAGRNPTVTSQELGRSNGVISPPPISDRSVITPKSNGDPGMQTAPDIRTGPRTPNVRVETRGGVNRDIPNAEAARNRTALQGALTAARASAERGDEQACQESLSQARQIAERSAH